MDIVPPASGAKAAVPDSGAKPAASDEAAKPPVPDAGAKPPVPDAGARPAPSRWRLVVVGALRDATRDQVALAAAGCAFYATLSLFPAISMLISVYGLAFDVMSVEQQLEVVRDLLPAPAFQLIDDRVHELVSQPTDALGISLIVSVLLACWSASAGVKSVLSALNVAYDTSEQRSIVRFQLVALGMTLCAVAAAVVAIAVLVFLPTVISFLWLSDHNAALIRLLSTGLLVVLVGGTIALLYRYGPSRPPPHNLQVFPGALLATLLWLVASVGLSFYVSHIASLGATYGPLGAVVAIMLWFYLSAYAVLLGAEVNAQIEQTGEEPHVISSGK
ncbi:MAG: YhjD/YihY/BrkB family envelope integrity protein [Acetobacteraceae bacterium]